MLVQTPATEMRQKCKQALDASLCKGNALELAQHVVVRGQALHARLHHSQVVPGRLLAEATREVAVRCGRQPCLPGPPHFASPACPSAEPPFIKYDTTTFVLLCALHVL